MFNWTSGRWSCLVCGSSDWTTSAILGESGEPYHRYCCTGQELKDCTSGFVAAHWILMALLRCQWTNSAVLKRLKTRAGRSRRRARPSSPVALFTGIVQGKARIHHLEVRGDEFRSLQVQLPPGMAQGIVKGASVALNGTCLTVTKVQGDQVHFDVIEETLRATNLGKLNPGDNVNYERSARMGDEIGGHQVSGHVHCTATIREVRSTNENCRMVFQVPPRFIKYLLPKGFVAVDGCSLTIGEVETDSFSVYLIPETLSITVLGEKSMGDMVNIEIDAQTQAIVDTVERVLEQRLMWNMQNLQLLPPCQGTGKDGVGCPSCGMQSIANSWSWYMQRFIMYVVPAVHFKSTPLNMRDLFDFNTFTS